jgi:hypothetical protein
MSKTDDDDGPIQFPSETPAPVRIKMRDGEIITIAVDGQGTKVSRQNGGVAAQSTGDRFHDWIRDYTRDGNGEALDPVPERPNIIFTPADGGAVEVPDGPLNIIKGAEDTPLPTRRDTNEPNNDTPPPGAPTELPPKRTKSGSSTSNSTQSPDDHNKNGSGNSDDPNDDDDGEPAKPDEHSIPDWVPDPEPVAERKPISPETPQLPDHVALDTSSTGPRQPHGESPQLPDKANDPFDDATLGTGHMAIPPQWESPQLPDKPTQFGREPGHKPPGMGPIGKTARPLD